MNWITFVGEGRSGHTVISGILGSHPHVRISEEQKYVSKWLRGMSREDILSDLHASGTGRYRRNMHSRIAESPGVSRSIRFENLGSYEDPLMAVGDKCGWDSVNEILKRKGDPRILDYFGEAMGMPVKVIHTSRHPLDNIASWVNSPKYLRLHGDDIESRMVRRYSRFYEAAEKIMEGQDVYHLRNEELIHNPEGEIIKLATWLELPILHPWIDEVSHMISGSAHRGRDEVNWNERLKQEVLGSRVIGRYPSLAYYKED